MAVRIRPGISRYDDARSGGTGGCVWLRGRCYLFGRHRLLAGLAQLLDRLLVVSQILLAADEDDGEALAEVKNLGNPL